MKFQLKKRENKMSEKEAVAITIRTALPSDAAGVLDHIRQTSLETGFMTVGAEGPGITPEEEKRHLENIDESENNFLLLALDDEIIIGMASIKGSASPKIKHIGELGISILKEYWGMGLGTLLVKDLIEWAESSQVIKRLELTVQKRNERAIHVYEKLGFEQEAIMKRGVKDDGVYRDVCLMSRLIGEAD